MFYGYFDSYFFIFVIPAIILALWAQINVQTTFRKYSEIKSRRGITGAEVARKILDSNGLHDISVNRVEGNLTDHYNPKNRTVNLSSGVYDSPSVAAIGIAAHETGHAVQHSTSYFPLVFRNAIIPITQIGSNLAIPLVLIGMFFASFSFLIDIGVWLFFTVVIFQLVTLPVEFNASRRAIETIDGMNLVDGEELGYTKKVLRAAALTYVAALAVALANFLRLFMIANGRRRND